MIAAMLTLVVAALLMVVALMFAAEIGWLMVDPTPLQLKRIESGLSGTPRIAQGGKPSQGVTTIDSVMQQEAFHEGEHLVLRERRSETLKRGLRSVP
jgi:hypothetical protein